MVISELLENNYHWNRNISINLSLCIISVVLLAVLHIKNVSYSYICLSKIGPGAMLINCNFNKKDLQNKDMNGADLTNANLIETNLKYANLTNAILTKADLSYADLTKATLEGVTLDGANLHGVIGVTDDTLAKVFKCNE
jgi:uncharacterized protein YjbI with pentapeptide repeats